MRMKTNFLNIATLLMLTISVIGCGSDEPFSAPSADDSEMVNLVLNIYAGDPGISPVSRASSSQDFVPADSNYFEGPKNSYEVMHTLRIIIVRPDGTVEHNELLSNSFPAAGLTQYSGARYPVIGGEQKTVYLFANEASMPKVDFNKYPVSSNIEPVEFDNLTIPSGGKRVLIDNRPNGQEMNVPMSECFKINVRKAEKDGGNYDQAADLFITRAAVKYSFHFTSTEAPHESYYITRIDVSGIADLEYLLPNNATYVPSKYPSTFSDRWIKKYDTPNSVTAGTYSLIPVGSGKGIEIPSTLKPLTDTIHYAPPIYLPESPTPDEGKFKVTFWYTGCDIENGHQPTEGHETAELPNLPALPRNTHVKVNVLLTKGDIKCTVDILPYSAVPLNPEFGFDELLPRPPAVPGEVPPWITVDPDEKGDNSGK